MRRILVVDDSPLIREVARVGLETVGGFAVTAVESGPEALSQAAADPPDAILLDVVMEGLDGPQTLALLRGREATRETPVLFLTAKAEDTVALGDARGVIAKPFDVATLAGEVADALGWPR